VRFLLDEMYPPVAAERLRDRDIDALAVKESNALAGLDDDVILALATLDQRVLVTENIADFAVLGKATNHVGIVFCHPRRFPRDANHLQRFVSALARLNSAAPSGLGDQPVQWWLKPPDVDD
jgi:hypothetical protein